jgi:hypothetical protein
MKRYRVVASSWGWYDADEYVRDFEAGVEEVEAEHPLEALAAADLHLSDVRSEHVVVDCECLDSEHPRSGAESPWRVCLAWFPDCGQHAAAALTLLSDEVVVVGAPDGALGIGMAAQAHVPGVLLPRAMALLGAAAEPLHEASCSYRDRFFGARAPTRKELETLLRSEHPPATSPAQPAPAREPYQATQKQLLAVRVLERIAMAATREEALHAEEVSADLNLSPRVLAEAVADIEHWGLGWPGWGEQTQAFATRAGLQFLELRGRVPMDVLRFVAEEVDDLYSREALRSAMGSLLDEMTFAADEAEFIHIVRRIVPPAFAHEIDPSFARAMHAAASALAARLGEGRPAACRAEEIVAVAVLWEAEAVLESITERLATMELRHPPTNALQGLFELFEDDDVLELFEMKEPADAVVVANDPIAQAMGTGAMDFSSWFEPFGWAVAVGHLDDRADGEWLPQIEP